MTGKPKTLLVWDIDDVLNRFMFHCLRRFPTDKHLKYEELSVMPPYGLLGISKEQYLATLDSCRPELYKEGPKPELLRFFERHGADFHHVALSAAPVRFAPYSAQWLLQYFGLWIQHCIFIPSQRAGVVVRSQRFQSKGEALASLGANAVLIDDSPLNTADAEKYGCRAMLFPAPWNENRNMPVEDFLNELLKLK